MRFVCDSCRAQYMISDDKIGAKGAKVRCKKCGHVITVRTSGATATKEDAPETAEAALAENKPRSDSAGLPASVGTPPEGGLFTDVEEDEIGAVFDQVLNSGSHKIPAGEPVGEAAEKKSASDAILNLSEAEEGEPKTPASAHEWFVAIDEKQVGPLTVEKVKDHWERGEVGPDSLCWRSGFGDWIPLSEATELASVLAPRPSSKPVIVAPAALSTSTPTVQAPVESAFSAGNASKSSRAESPLAASAATEEPSGWKPSAASVLASLVKEEDEALSRPAPAPAPEPVVAARTTSLLDIPMPEPTPGPAAPAPMGAMPVQAPVMAPPPAAPAPYAPPAAPYAQPGYSAYPPPAAVPPPASGNRMALFGAMAAVVLLGLGGGVVYMMTRPPAPTVPSGAVATTASGTEPVQPTAAPPVAKPAEPTPAGTVQTPPAGSTAVAGTQQPAAVPTTPPTMGTPAAQGTPVAAQTPPPPAPAAEPVKPAEPPKANTARAEATEPKVTPKKSGGTSASSEPEPKVARNEARAKPDVSDDEFDELFGSSKKPTKQAEPTEPKRPATYIPPEPGTSKAQERLAQSDVMQVVLNNKPAIVKCVNEQKKKDPTISGKLVMRWSIQTSGKTSAIVCQSPEFKSTYMAKCIGDLIKTWTFPKHQKQGDPIVFPFTF